MAVSDPYDIKYRTGNAPTVKPPADEPLSWLTRAGLAMRGGSAAAPAAPAAPSPANPRVMTPQAMAFRGLMGASTPEAPTAALPGASPAPYDPTASYLQPNGLPGRVPAADASSLPEGVTARGPGMFQGKGQFGERVFSDTAFAPQFAGVANATGAQREGFNAQYGASRKVQNASDYTFQRALEADIAGAGEDYKAYVSAGSPRVQGRGLTESDFIERRRSQRLSSFLGDENGRGGVGGAGAGGNGRRSGLQADAIALNDAALNTAKGERDLEKSDIAINEAANARADKEFDNNLKTYTDDPDSAARRYGRGITPRQAAAADLAINMVNSGIDPITTERGREGLSFLESKIGGTNSNRAVFAGEDGMFPVGSAPAALENYQIQRRGLGARIINSLTGDPDYVLQSPAFDKRDGQRNVPIDPNDPNAERFTNYENGLTGAALGGSAGQDFLARYQGIARRRNQDR